MPRVFAIVPAAGRGMRIGEHGNRAMAGMWGSADNLGGLGGGIAIPPADAIHGIDRNGFSFLLAPLFHQSMKYAVAPRREIGIPSIFNHLGPLTNPAGARRQLLGVSDRHFQETIAEALVGLGSERARVVAAEAGLAKGQEVARDFGSLHAHGRLAPAAQNRGVAEQVAAVGLQRVGAQPFLQPQGVAETLGDFLIRRVHAPATGA